ncbi:MAG: GAF domain-containing protein [Woeseiaceae bacterium]
MSPPEAPIAPAFGEAQLSNCEREQIHLPGSIQPHGALVVIDPATLDTVQASANAAGFLGLEASPVGQPVAQLCEWLPEQIERLGADSSRELPLYFRCRIGASGREFDCLIHRSADGAVINEFFAPGAGDDIAELLQRTTQQVSESTSLDTLCNRAAELFYELTGYDRVMIYQFDRDGHGQVRAEKFEKDLEPFLGNRYPATDIPQIARKLYVTNRVRMLGDVGYEPVPVQPRMSPKTHRDLDMSMCFLRSISPIHIQYLKNMGVNATLVMSIVVGGELWGLVACHHYSPRVISIDLCAACELVAENMATRITAFEGNAHAHVDWSVRRFESQLLEGISRFGDWKEALVGGPDYLLRPFDAEGAALFVDGEVFTTGAVPGTNQLREIRRWIMQTAQRTDGPFVQTASLGTEDERFAVSKAVASGVLAVPISNSQGEYLAWFRPEQVRTDTWGGNPAKAVTIGDDPSELSPRRSFAKWQQEVKGKSVPWSSVELSTAERIGRSVAELVVHFRSVRALIIEDQLNSVFRKVSRSQLPIVITDAHRKIILANEAFQQLLPPGTPQLQGADDLPGLFTDAERFRDQLIELCDRQKEIRTEAQMRQRSREPLALLVRGDPVFVAERRVIGYVLMFSDLSEHRAVRKARRDFQRTIEQQASSASRAFSRLTLNQRELTSTVVGNAKHAALDITDGQDVHRIPELLDSVRRSMERSLELVDHLVPGPAEPPSSD